MPLESPSSLGQAAAGQLSDRSRARGKVSREAVLGPVFQKGNGMEETHSGSCGGALI